MGSEEERKKLVSEKQKYIVRLNKIIDQTKQRQLERPKKIKELKKCYAYCVEGSLEELEFLWKCIKSDCS